MTHDTKTPLDTLREDVYYVRRDFIKNNNREPSIVITFSPHGHSAVMNDHKWLQTCDL